MLLSLLSPLPIISLQIGVGLAVILTVLLAVAWVGQELTLTASEANDFGTLLVGGTTLASMLYLVGMHWIEFCWAWLAVTATVLVWAGIGWCVEQAVRWVQDKALQARRRAESLAASVEETEEEPPPPGIDQ